MAHLPGLSEEEESKVYALSEEINNLDKAVSSIGRAIKYFDGDLVRVSSSDLEVVMKYALMYQKKLLNERSKYQQIIEENTPKPSFK